MTEESAIKLAEFWGGTPKNSYGYNLLGDYSAFNNKLDNPVIKYFTYNPEKDFEDNESKSFIKIMSKKNLEEITKIYHGSKVYRGPTNVKKELDTLNQDLKKSRLIKNIFPFCNNNGPAFGIDFMGAVGCAVGIEKYASKGDESGFWALMAALGLFTSSAIYKIFEGNKEIREKKLDIEKFSEVLNKYNNFTGNIENAEIKIYSPVEAQELIKDVTNSKNADFMSNERINNKLKEIYLNYKE